MHSFRIDLRSQRQDRPAPRSTPEPAVMSHSGDSFEPQARPTLMTSAQFSFNPQDPSVLEPDRYSVQGLLPGPAIATNRVKLNYDLTPAADGHYVFGGNDVRAVAANSFAAVQRTVDLFWNAYDIQKWGFAGQQLQVNPLQGEDLDASYNDDEGSINLFGKADKVTGMLVYSGASGEAISHEVGHALLHAIRPAYVRSTLPDTAAFRESFADVTAFLGSLKDERVLARVVEQTHGDLSASNVASQIGEQLGVAINHEQGSNITGGPFLRDARNDLTWTDPAHLPYSTVDPNLLCRDEHSLSRVWTGAYYDVFTQIAKQNMESGQTPTAALRSAAEEGLQMYVRLMQHAPQGEFTYKQMAQAFVSSDQELNRGQHAELIARVFTDRKILDA